MDKNDRTRECHNNIIVANRQNNKMNEFCYDILTKRKNHRMTKVSECQSVRNRAEDLQKNKATE